VQRQAVVRGVVPGWDSAGLAVSCQMGLDADGGGVGMGLGLGFGGGRYVVVMQDGSGYALAV
jgi:hypothetical protein